MIAIGDIRFWAAAGIVLLYGGFSDPTPDQPGIVEAVIGAGLLTLVGVWRGVLLVSGVGALLVRQEPAVIVRNLAFMYLMIVPTLVALTRQVSLVDLVRDLIPMLYLFLPVLVGERLLRYRSEQRMRLLLAACTAAGIVLAIRHLAVTAGDLALLGSAFASEHSLYLSTDSFVHFAAAFLLMHAIRMASFLRPGRLLLAVALFTAGLFCLAVLGLKGHRGPVALTVLVCAIYVVMAPGSAGPGRARLIFVSALLASAVLVFFGDVIAGLWQLFLAKHEAVGLSNRDAEFLEIVGVVFRHWPDAFFGLGFGSVYASPAAASTVNFAHWIGGYILLKAGIIGALFLAVYLASFTGQAFRALRTNTVAALAIAGPMLIGLTISGTYRFLSFGILLTVLYLLGHRGRPSLATECNTV